MKKENTLNKGRVIYVPLTVGDGEILKEQYDLIDLLCESHWKYRGVVTLTDRLMYKMKFAILLRERKDAVNSYKQKTLLEVTK